MLVVNKNRHLAKKEIHFPIDGKLSLDENCMVEVSDELGKLLVQSDEWNKVKGEDDEEDGKTDADIKELLEQIDEMSLAQLVEVAKEANVPGWEKVQGKENVLRAFIKNKLKKG